MSETTTGERCQIAGCTKPVLLAFNDGPRRGERWCFEHGPVREVLTRGVSRYEAFGRAAEPLLIETLDELQIEREACLLTGEHEPDCGRCAWSRKQDAAMWAALALLDGEETNRAHP